VIPALAQMAHLLTRCFVQIAIMLDTKGPEIRTGFFDAKYNGKLELKAGQDLELVTDYDYKTTDGTKLAISYPSLCTSVKAGGMILAADGNLVLKVKEIREKSVMVCLV
jgi:pyruvate kinase